MFVVFFFSFLHFLFLQSTHFIYYFLPSQSKYKIDIKTLHLIHSLKLACSIECSDADTARLMISFGFN